jgi:transposase
MDQVRAKRSTLEGMHPELTVTSEQINSLPLLLGIVEDMGIRHLIDAHVTPHGHWQGISVGTAVTIWLCCLLQEHDHRLVLVRDWATARAHTLNTLLDITLRDTDCSDDRLANILTMLGDPATQASLDAALVQQWVRVYRLPTQTMRLDSTSVSVYHDPEDPDSLLHFGHSKDHRPDLRQFKAMLATLDPLGLPLVCQMVGGECADDPLYVPAYDAAVTALGTAAVLVVGDSKMAALATRGHLVAHGSRYLCPYRPPRATAELATWVETALARADTWQGIETVDPQTGEVTPIAVIDTWTRDQRWTDPETTTAHRWRERVLVVRSSAYQAGQRTLRERALARLTEQLMTLWQPPARGRKRYTSRCEVEQTVAGWIERAGLTSIVQAPVVEEQQADGTTRWTVGAIAVDLAAWAALVARLGWQVYLSNTTEEEYDTAALVATYHQQPLLERGISRLKTRNLQIRPVYLRDETRMAGLLWLLTLALRVLTLTEYRLRTTLAERDEGVAGLNPASRSQTTRRPTTERVLAAFANLTVTTVHKDGVCTRYLTPLNATQRHLLILLKLPADLYDRLAEPSPNLVHHLRE